MLNLVTLLPKGALTAKPYAFKLRAWELSSIETIDFNDHYNSNIYIQYKNSKIIRVLPKKIKNSISIITDISRFSFDSLKYNRSTVFSNFFLESKKSSRDYISKNLVIISDNLDLGNLNLLKTFQIKNSNLLLRKNIYSLNSFFVSWNSVSSFFNFEFLSKICFISSTLLSVESVLLNLKIRLKFNKKQIRIFYCGYYINSNYSLKFLSLKIKSLFYFFKSKSIINFAFVKDFKYLTFIIGEALIRRFKELTQLLNFFKQRIKTCLLYFITKQKNYLVSQIIPFKVLTRRILLRTRKRFLVDLEDNLQVSKFSVTTSHCVESLITVSSFDTSLSKVSKYNFPSSSIMESSGIYIDFEQKLKKSNKFSGIRNKSITNIIISCFQNYYYTKQILNFYKKRFIVLHDFIFSTLVLEYFKKLKNRDCFPSFYQQTFLFCNLMRLNFYPDKLFFEDRYRINQISKNSLTMLNCSINERKQTSNF